MVVITLSSSSSEKSNPTELLGQKLKVPIELWLDFVKVIWL